MTEVKLKVYQVVDKLFLSKQDAEDYGKSITETIIYHPIEREVY